MKITILLFVLSMGTCLHGRAVYNVASYGAIGNGTTDDTIAVQETINAAVSGGGGTVYFPPKTYRITATLTINQVVPIELVGEGKSSEIYWANDVNLFKWTVLCVENTIKNLRITPLANKSVSSTVFKCNAGMVRTVFDNVLVLADSYTMGSGICSIGITDSCRIDECQFWNVSGTGIQLGNGSQVIITGGRIIGANKTTSTGVYLKGGNGGVHIVSTDIIALRQGVVTAMDPTFGSNREVFITHATLDGCWMGLAVQDDSYISIAGCWAASCDHDNIWVEAGHNPLLVIAGGTIFGAGAGGGTPDSGECNGITINSGSFILEGVCIRNNKGKGLWVPNSSVSGYVVTGCKFYSNTFGNTLSGTNYMFSHNILNGNGPFSYSGSGYQILNNITH